MVLSNCKDNTQLSKQLTASPSAFTKTGEWQKVKSHKALHVSEACVVMACCCNMAVKDSPVPFGLLLQLALIHLAIAAGF